MQPNTFGEANRLHGRARGSAANGNKITPSAFFKMHGSVLGPLNMCARVFATILVFAVGGDQEAWMIHNERKTLHLCT